MTTRATRTPSSLLGALPSAGEVRKRRLTSIPGAPPDLVARPTCCSFLPRCDFAVERCRVENPALAPAPEVAVGDVPHRIACWVDIRDRRVPAQEGNKA